MQCVTCQGTKKHAGVDCYDCHGTGYTLPEHIRRADREKAEIELMAMRHTQAEYNEGKKR